MPSQRQLKGRIRSVKSTKQITKAMQMVAASKMRRAQDATKASSPYVKTASELLSFLASQGATDNHPLFVRREVKKRLIIFIAADKGLAGAYNTNVFKKYIELLENDKKHGVSSQTLTIGRKASRFAVRLKSSQVIATYEDMPDDPGGVTFHTILGTILDAYRRQDVDAVTVVYTHFMSSIVQESAWLRLLPAGTGALVDVATIPNSISDATFEPSKSKVLNAVVQRLVGAHLFQALLDARASEHSMRMLAMKNATDNASDLVDDLTLAMNKARQGAITQELSEISGGVEAMK